MALEITDSSFNEAVLQSDKPVLVDFWAPQCKPCNIIAPMIEELSNDFKDKAIVGKVNVDNNQQSAVEYGIRSIPTLLIFKNGELVDRIVGGATPKEELAKKLNALL